MVFPLYSKVNQPHISTYALFLGFPSHLGRQRAQVPWAMRRFSLVLRFIHSISGVYTIWNTVTQGLVKFSLFHQNQLLLTKLGREEEGSFSLIWSEPPRKEDHTLKGSENDLLRSISAPFRGECTHSHLLHMRTSDSSLLWFVTFCFYLLYLAITACECVCVYSF